MAAAHRNGVAVFAECQAHEVGNLGLQFAAGPLAMGLGILTHLNPHGEIGV